MHIDHRHITAYVLAVVLLVVVAVAAEHVCVVVIQDC